MSQATLSSRYHNSNLFSGYYLDERISDREEWDCDAEAAAVLEELQQLYDEERGLVGGYNEDPLIDNWISEVLEILGFGTQVEPTLPEGDGFVDVLLFEDEGARREAASVYLDTNETVDLFERGLGLVEAKQWDADFSARFSEQRPYHNASQQIKRYLNKTPENIQWGVLTNGRKWRLYGTKDYETQTYYEVDLPELLERGDVEAFKYFYLFFRPAAFRETGGEAFLDSVWSESETAAQELGEDLQDNVFTALRVLGRGFVESNDLDIDPDDDAALDELKEQSLVLLYRLMFVLYAESRNLIHPEDAASQAEYEENFSLDSLRLEIHEEIGEVDEGFDTAFSEHSTGYWSRLEDLFGLIDEGEASLGIPPYNGGLFDHDKHAFLADHEVSNRHLAEVIYRLSTTENEAGRYVLADYADLDTRHLGSVYEGLLEHQFEIAAEDYAAVTDDGGQVWKPATEVTVADAVETVPEGGLYVVNDEGERKATGAYYTPDYVVTYIVEETVGPLVDEIREDLIEQGFEAGTQEYLGPFLQRVTDLKILDPAMGSGHFLTRATGYLAERVMDEVREVEVEMGVAFDEQHVRREIAKECIYGVDINGMAVELAKLSMWLETLAADRPLAFLDHHLKAGNSLVGSDVTEVLTDDNGDDGGQLTLTQALARVRQDTLEHVMELMEDLLAIDNETLDDVHSMEEIYDEIRADPLYQRLFELTNVHTAERFGVDVPEGVYEQMAGAIESESEWSEIQEEDWFRTAQATAEEEGFFHWELEYPEAFFSESGRLRKNAGFDAVISNPPYIRVQNLRGPQSELVDYLINEGRYSSSKGKFDIYAPFLERGSQLAVESRLCYILPNKFIQAGWAKHLREHLVENRLISSIVDFSQHQVFSGVTTYTCILSLKEGVEQFEYLPVRNFATTADQIRNLENVSIDTCNLDSGSWALTGPEERKVLQKIEESEQTVGEISEYISQGIKSGDNDVFFVEIVDEKDETTIVRSPATDEEFELENEMVKPLIHGNDIKRYNPILPTLAVVYPHSTQSKVIKNSKLQRDFPKTYNYISNFQTRLSDRAEVDKYDEWYALSRPREKQLFETPKLVVPDVCQRPEFAVDNGQDVYVSDSAYAIVLKSDSKSSRFLLLAILNSSVAWFYIYKTSSVLRGDFRRIKTSYLSPLPIPKPTPEQSPENAQRDFDKLWEEAIDKHKPEIDELSAFLAYLGRKSTELHDDHDSLNLALLDHLGSYSDGQTFADIGLTQPPEGAADSILQKTTETHPNLRVGTCEVIRESPTSVEIRLTARYKPDDEDAQERDQWGYTETEPLPALEVSDLTETEADLIEHFVPVAVDEAGGFAEFRETATKTNSLVDRLRKLTLPAVDDVEAGLESYIETKRRADELDAKIEKTDRLIDEIVYELYGLTDEEIEIVEEAVGE